MLIFLLCIFYGFGLFCAAEMLHDISYPEEGVRSTSQIDLVSAAFDSHPEEGVRSTSQIDLVSAAFDSYPEKGMLRGTSQTDLPSAADEALSEISASLHSLSVFTPPAVKPTGSEASGLLVPSQLEVTQSTRERFLEVARQEKNVLSVFMAQHMRASKAPKRAIDDLELRRAAAINLRLGLSVGNSEYMTSIDCCSAAVEPEHYLWRSTETGKVVERHRTYGETFEQSAAKDVAWPLELLIDESESAAPVQIASKNIALINMPDRATMTQAAKKCLEGKNTQFTGKALPLLLSAEAKLFWRFYSNHSAFDPSAFDCLEEFNDISHSGSMHQGVSFMTKVECTFVNLYNALSSRIADPVSEVCECVEKAYACGWFGQRSFVEVIGIIYSAMPLWLDAFVAKQEMAHSYAEAIKLVKARDAFIAPGRAPRQEHRYIDALAQQGKIGRGVAVTMQSFQLADAAKSGNTQAIVQESVVLAETFWPFVQGSVAFFQSKIEAAALEQPESKGWGYCASCCGFFSRHINDGDVVGTAATLAQGISEFATSDQKVGDAVKLTQSAFGALDAQTSALRSSDRVRTITEVLAHTKAFNALPTIALAHCARSAYGLRVREAHKGTPQQQTALMHMLLPEDTETRGRDITLVREIALQRPLRTITQFVLLSASSQ